MIDFQSLLIENIIASVPFSLLYVLFALIFCGYKDKIKFKPILYFTLIQTTLDVFFTILLHKYGSMQTVPYMITAVFLIMIFFNLDILTSIICIVLPMIFIGVTQAPYFFLVSAVLGMPFDDFINIFESNTTLKLASSYIYYGLLALLIMVLYKKNVSLFDLKKHNLLNKINKKYRYNIKLIAIIFLPLLVVIILNFSVRYFQVLNNINISSMVYLTIEFVSLFISSIIMLYLIKRIITLSPYEIEWTTQQKYLEDVNTLLKRLREQKHGFNNHMNILNGYLSLNKLDSAKEYLRNIHDVVCIENDSIVLNNPSLNTLLNIKVKSAESNNVKFVVNVADDISNMKFNVFEVGEAIGNIIDNAIEATSEQEIEKRNVKIDIYSDEQFYIFDIQNSGKTIAREIISKIFEEGFTTKTYENGEHGLGLYISRKIIEFNRGKIEVESNEGITSFKIYLPKVMKNEFKAS